MDVLTRYRIYITIWEVKNNKCNNNIIVVWQWSKRIILLLLKKRYRIEFEIILV